MKNIIFNLDNFKGDVPYLRGKLQFLSILSFPYLASLLENDRLPYEIKVSILVFLFSYILNLAGSTLLHNNQRYKYRSAYKRIDIASKFIFLTLFIGIFLILASNIFPIQMYYMNNDLLLALLSAFQWILTFAGKSYYYSYSLGVFGALVFDFCCISKNIRSLIHFLITLPNFYLIYKMIKTGDMAKNTCLGAIYFLTFIGTLIYCKEGPNLILGIFEHHELFHILCLFAFVFVVMLNKLVVFDKFK